MTLFRLAPAMLCALAMGAHALRSGWGLLVAGGLAVWPLMFLVRRRWVPVLARLLLVAGALEWLRTAQGYARQRETLGQPSGRLWLILGGVAAANLAAAALLSGEGVRVWFGRGRE